MADAIDLDDPGAQKMLDSFKKVSMHQFWKKVKTAVKADGGKEEKDEFNKLYKSFNMGLGKLLDKFDAVFPNPAEVKKYAAQLEKIYTEYDKKIDKVEIGRGGMLLSGAIGKLDAETKRRVVWCKKYIK